MSQDVAEPRTHATSDDEPNTLLNALIGAAVTVLTSPILPLAAIAGGGVAGYLQRGDPTAGAVVGAVSGVIASIPVVFVAWFMIGVLFLGAAPAPLSLFAVFVVVLIVGYLVGAGALGGALGAYLRREL